MCGVGFPKEIACAKRKKKKKNSMCTARAWRELGQTAHRLKLVRVQNVEGEWPEMGVEIEHGR